MLMYNLLEYSSNYSEATVSLWFYSENKANNFNNNIENNNYFKSFKYQAKLLGNTEVDVDNGIFRLFLLSRTQNYMFL